MVTKVKNTNIDLSGSTDGTVMPKGTTAQRPSSTAGLLRYNTTTGNLEQANGTEFQAIDLPPNISSVSGYYNEDANTTITITGSGFKSGSTVTFVNASTGSDVASSPTVTVVSASEITATTGFDSSPISASITSLKVRVTKQSGLSATSTATISLLGDPTFTNAAGSLGTIYDSGRAAGLTFNAGATTTDSQTISYSIISGNIPTNMSLNTSTGVISGTPDAVGSDTTSTFTIKAAVQTGDADSTIRFATREFSITIAAPTVAGFTASGSDTFVAPFTGNYEVLVVGGGGGGGSKAGGGGGGIVYKASHPLTAGSIPITIGAAGSPGQFGTDSVLTNITARGGGRANDNGGANTGGRSPQGGQGGCAGNPYTSTNANVADGGTPYGGYRGGGQRNQHYFWGGGGGGGSGGNGEEPHGCGGTCDGGVGVYISQFSSYGASGYFGGGGAGSQDRYDPVNPNGGPGVNGLGNNADGTGGGGPDSNGGRAGGIYIRY